MPGANRRELGCETLDHLSSDIIRGCMIFDETVVAKASASSLLSSCIPFYRGTVRVLLNSDLLDLSGFTASLVPVSSFLKKPSSRIKKTSFLNTFE